MTREEIEIQFFELYAKWVWPIQRRFLGETITPRCATCAISANASTLENGCCEACRIGATVREDQACRTSETTLSALIKTMSNAASGDYDAAVLFSGGKDSTYMLHRLRSEYPSLRLIALTIDNSFMSSAALRNIETVLQKFDVPHRYLRPPAAVMEKMFRYAFLNLKGRGTAQVVDQFDGDFFCDYARNFAHEHRIPYIFCGLSPFQVDRILGLQSFLTSKEEEGQNRVEVADLALAEIFSEEERRTYWWHGADCPYEERPQLVFPFCGWQLPEGTIRKETTRLNLLASHSESPLVTNNQLIPLMAIVDFCRLGYSSFEPEFAEMARRGDADTTYWRPIFELGEYTAKTGRFAPRNVENVLRRLALTRSELGIPW
ncbi:MAG: hypothetical protein KDD69_15925 [Bdellovibrionales bacterium]|nr:hypothetical protein [Bdellovibrionales bacterium]